MFVVTVANTHFKPYGSMDPLQLPIDEIKVSEESTSLLQVAIYDCWQIYLLAILSLDCLAK